MQKHRNFSSSNSHHGAVKTDEPRSFRPQKSTAPQLPVASVLRIRNFKALAEVGGVENLALALNMVMPRVTELLSGVNFTDETAYHIETTLGLANGFMDQVNPRLAPANVARLSAPLEVIGEAEQDPAPVLLSTTSPAPEATAVSGATAMAATSTAPRPRARAKTASPVAPAVKALPTPVTIQTTLVSSTPSSKPRPVKDPVMPKKPVKSQQSPAPSAPSAPPVAAVDAVDAVQGTVQAADVLREIRRNNLHLLTKEPGAKSELARLTGLSPANISHRLHGNKHFDDDTVQFFSKKLGLSDDWFNTAHEDGEVPPEVRTRLKEKTPAETPPPRPAPVKVFSGTISTGLGAARRTEDGIAAPYANNPPAGPRIAPPQAPVRKVLARSAPETIARRGHPKSAEARMSAPPEQQSELALMDAPPTVTSTPIRPSPVVEAVQSGSALGAIAEALIKTLAAKSRQGRLSEEAALKLLTDAMQL